MSDTADDPREDAEWVRTPGGPRRKDRVHGVGPGEAVRMDEAGNAVVIAHQGVAPTSAAGNTAATDDMVLTPGGFRPQSLVHLIEPGYVLDGTENHLRKLHPSGAVVADFGLLPPRPTNRPLMPENVGLLPGSVAALGEGWIAYANWGNTTGHPISLFTTTWLVPPAPTTQSGQTIFLFNGIMNSTMIYQPVLQWGASGAGGGNYWAVASWYADGQGGPAFYSPLVHVNPGDVLVGVMALTGQGGGGFSYLCQFQGIANTSLPIQNVPELTWCSETLEAYGISQCSDYPAAVDTAFRAITLQTGGAPPPLNWAPANGVTDCGQHTVVVSNSAAGGEVDVFYPLAGKPVASRVRPAVVQNADGRLEVFIIGASGGVYHAWQVAPGGTWAGWSRLGGPTDQGTRVVAARNADGRLEAFVTRPDGGIYHNRQVTPRGAWAGWGRLGGPADQGTTLAVAQNADRRLEVFIIGAAGGIYHSWQVAPGGAWSAWQRLGGPADQGSALTIGRNGDGRLELFITGADGGIYHSWQIPNVGWSGWERLGGPGAQGSALAVGQNADGRLELFITGADQGIYHAWQILNVGWSGWQRLGGTGGALWSQGTAPSVGLNADGRMEVFSTGADQGVYHAWQVPRIGRWSDWARLGGPNDQEFYPVAAQNADGRIEVFAIGRDNNIDHAWQTTPNGGWSAWWQLG